MNRIDNGRGAIEVPVNPVVVSEVLREDGDSWRDPQFDCVGLTANLEARLQKLDERRMSVCESALFVSRLVPNLVRAFCGIALERGMQLSQMSWCNAGVLQKHVGPGIFHCSLHCFVGTAYRIPGMAQDFQMQCTTLPD